MTMTMQINESFKLLFDRVLRSVFAEIPEFAEQVQPVYQFNKWGWHDDNHIPTVKELETALYRLLQSVTWDKFKEFGYMDISSGRLQILVFLRSDGNIDAELQLVPKSIDCSIFPDEMQG